jgi:hypothetical protein
MKQLVSVGALRGERGSIHLGISYNIFELAFLHFVKELRLDPPASASRLQAETESLEGQLAENEERKARIQGEMERCKPDEIAGLAEVLRRLETSLTAQRDTLERLQAEKRRDTADDVKQLKTLVDLYEQAEKEGKSEEFRTKLRGKIRQLVKDVWVLVEGGRYHRTATVQVYFRDGGSRFIHIEHIVRGKKAGCEMGSGTAEELGFDLDLRNYRKPS